MQKQNNQKQRKLHLNIHPRSRPLTLAASMFMVLAVFVIGSQVVPVFASQLDQQIRDLRNKNAQSQSQLAGLQSQASSYQDAINRLQSQIDGLQARINESTARQEQLQQQIAENKVKLEQQRATLRAVLKAMYVSGHLTPIEQLATSKDLSEFVDAETYRTAVQTKIQKTLDEINRLQAQLTSQKIEVEELIAQQKKEQEQVASVKAEQQRMLAYNESQQSEFESQIAANKDKIAELQRQQVLENARLFGGNVPAGVPGGGGYKYGDAVCLWAGYADPPCRQYDWGYPSASSPRNLYDEWGYGYRNCTSWVAFKLSVDGKSGFAHLGNANQWPGNVPSTWKSYGGGARPGDAAVSMGGSYGHVMYVEAVEGGTAYVSDYNFGGDGYYRQARAVSQSSLVFIHFP